MRSPIARTFTAFLLSGVVGASLIVMGCAHHSDRGCQLPHYFRPSCCPQGEHSEAILLQPVRLHNAPGFRSPVDFENSIRNN